jgi:hypothetical protein
MATKSSKKPVRKTKTVSKKVTANKTSAAKVSKKSAAKTLSSSVNTRTAGSRLKNLRLWQAVVGGLHAIFAILILVMSNSHSVAVSTNFLTSDSLSDAKPLVPASRQLFDVRTAWLVAGFLGVAAIYHLLVATVLNAHYQKAVANRVNRMRWVEWVLESGLVLVGIAMLLGVRDMASLFLLFVVNEGIHGLGYQLETGSKVYPRLPFKLAAKFTVTIVLVLGWFVFATNHYGSANLPGHVYWLLALWAVFFSLFSAVAVASYKRRGRFASFDYTEKTYAVLGLLAKVSIAGVIFFSILD